MFCYCLKTFIVILSSKLIPEAPMLANIPLQQVDQLSTNTSLKIDKNDNKYILISHPKFTAAFSLFGAHLLHFQRTNQAPLIWLSETALFNNINAIRGGVPICWPWFGSASEKIGNNLPAHGLARTSHWELHSVTEYSDGSGVEIEFLLTSSAQTLEIWPYSFELILKATLTDILKLQLISKNTSTENFYYTGALHTYLNVGSPEATHITGLSNEYCNKLNASKVELGDGGLTIRNAVDSIYRKTDGSILLTDNTLGREITVSNAGNDSNVLWTPWIEGATAFKDMPDDGYKTMFCVESAITDQPGILLKPNETHILSTTIKSNE